MTAASEPLGEVRTCPRCANEVPAATFCLVCGVRFDRAQHGRLQHYAASPDQGVVRLHLTSTLLPHVPSRDAAPFRAAFAAIVASLLVLGYVGFTSAAIAVAVAAFPLLYLTHLYAAGLHTSTVRWLTVANVAAAGAGIAWAHAFGPATSRAQLLDLTIGVTTGRMFQYGVGPALLAFLMVLAVPCVFVAFVRAREVLEPLTLAISGAATFTAARTIVELWPELRHSISARADRVAAAWRILDRGFTIPVLLAACCGATAIWIAQLRRMPVTDMRRRMEHPAVFAALSALAAAAVIATTGGYTVATDSNVATIAHLVLLAAALVLLRLTLHAALLDDTRDPTGGAAMPCAHCGVEIPLGNFCPNCGIAEAATPRTPRALQSAATP